MASRVQLNQIQVRSTSIRLAREEVRGLTASINRRARSNAPGGPYSTGRLKASINWSIRTIGDKVVGVSGSDLVYAYSVHEGQPARTITAKRAPMLSFYWRRVGKQVKFFKVNHPGTAPQPYLVQALLTQAPLYGFRVVVTR